MFVAVCVMQSMKKFSYFRLLWNEGSVISILWTRVYSFCLQIHHHFCLEIFSVSFEVSERLVLTICIRFECEIRLSLCITEILPHLRWTHSDVYLSRDTNWWHDFILSLHSMKFLLKVNSQENLGLLLLLLARLHACMNETLNDSSEMILFSIEFSTAKNTTSRKFHLIVNVPYTKTEIRATSGWAGGLSILLNPSSLCVNIHTYIWKWKEMSMIWM